MVWKLPRMEDLSAVVGDVDKTLFVCSPYITASGIDVLERSLKVPPSLVEVWTKFDGKDWLTGASDPDALLDFLERLPSKTKKRIRVSNALHAKLVVADSDVALAGSSNLTRGGFGSNIELVRVVSGSEMAEILAYISQTRSKLSLATMQQLKDFVTECQKQTKDREALQDLIRQVSPPSESGGTALIPLSDFINYCGKVGGYLAKEIRKVYSNLDGNNRTGHLKQAYYAVQRFLQEYPQHVNRLKGASLDVAFDPDSVAVVGKDWREFLQEFESDSNDAFGYDVQILLGYLTPAFGGRRKGGGGGDYPFKLVWPILARMMAQ